MAAKVVRRAVIYARISVSNDESVSIARQVESCTKYAESRGWDVAEVIQEDGVSATHNKPEDRKGWQRVLTLDESYQAVIVWKIDRLARRTLDFLHADEALQARGAAVVSVEQPIDMTTPEGRAFATMLAVFAEMEAHAIRTRVKAARDLLLRTGRLVGGTVPYGYRKARSSDGKGFILEQDPVTIAYVHGMVDRVLAGETIYSVQAWLNKAGAPLPTASQKTRKREGWRYSTVERILRNPVLAGMTAYNPGNASKTRGADVLRDDSGMPVVDRELAIVSLTERRKLLALLDNRTTPQARPRAGKQVTSPLLSGLATCGHCDRRMFRGTTQGRPSLSCPECYQTISTTQLVAHLESRLLAERGEHRAYDVTDVTDDDNASQLADIEEALRDVSVKLTRDNADMPTLLAQLDALKELRANAHAASPVRRNYRIKERVVRLEWEAAGDDVSRRAILATQIESLRIVRGKTGRYLDPGRVQLVWTPEIEDEAGHEYTYDT